jgi:hypothetical protein
MNDTDDRALRPVESEIDENGVDLAQVRAMLDRTPAERLATVSEFANGLLALRARNDTSRAG